MKFRILVTIHFIGIVLAILRLCFIPFENHLRYGIGHAVCWVILITAVLAFFCVPQAMPLRKWIKTYFGGYLFNTCFMALYPLALVVMFIIAAFIPGGGLLWVTEDCFVQALIPKPIECENAAYVIRKWDDVNYTDNSERFYLYRKAQHVEHLISIRQAAEVEYEKCYAKRILAVDESKGILKVEVDVYTGNHFVRKEIQEWTINQVPLNLPFLETTWH